MLLIRFSLFGLSQENQQRFWGFRRRTVAQVLVQQALSDMAGSPCLVQRQVHIVSQHVKYEHVPSGNSEKLNVMQFQKVQMPAISLRRVFEKQRSR